MQIGAKIVPVNREKGMKDSILTEFRKERSNSFNIFQSC